MGPKCQSSIALKYVKWDYQRGQALRRIAVKIFIMFRFVPPLASVLQAPTLFCRLRQRMTVSFSHFHYYPRGTDVVAMILGGSGRKSFRRLHTLFLENHLLRAEIHYRYWGESRTDA